MVPVMNHVRFEKVKNSDRRAKDAVVPLEKLIQQPVSDKLASVLEKHGLAPKATPKKENKLNIFRNKMKAKVKNSNQTIIALGPQAGEPIAAQP